MAVARRRCGGGGCAFLWLFFFLVECQLSLRGGRCQPPQATPISSSPAAAPPHLPRTDDNWTAAAAVDSTTKGGEQVVVAASSSETAAPAQSDSVVAGGETTTYSPQPISTTRRPTTKISQPISTTTTEEPNNVNLVETGFSSRIGDDFASASSSGWRPIPNPKSLAARGRSISQTSASATASTTSNTPRPQSSTVTPFQGSPELSPSGWIPIPYPKPPRKGRTRVVVEHDYDDIITAPPHHQHHNGGQPGETFELVVGASLSGGSTHPRPSSNNQSSPVRIKVVSPPRSFARRRKRRNAGEDVSTTLESGVPTTSGYDLPPEAKEFRLEKVLSADGVALEKLVIRQPIAVVSRDGRFYPGDRWQLESHPSPQPIVYVPVYEAPRTAGYFPQPYDSQSPFITRVTRPPPHRWTSSIVDRLFTVPRFDPSSSPPPSAREGSLDIERMFDNTFAVTPPYLSVEPALTSAPVADKDVTVKKAAAAADSVIINTNRGPHQMFVHSTVQSAHGFDEALRKRQKQLQKLDTKHFLAENESVSQSPSQAEDRNNKTSPGMQPFMSTESLAYVLIGACCGLSILCLLVVIVTMRCRRTLDDRKLFGVGSSHLNHAGLINGWETYPKESEMTYENNLLRASENLDTIQVDPWFHKQHGLSDVDFHRRGASPRGSVSTTNGIRFETLSVGPCKQIKRTTVIPAHSTALLTDGHTAVMRELSSVSSTSSSATSSRSLCSADNFHPYRPMIDEAPESLDIQEDLFDQRSMKKPYLPRIAEAEAAVRPAVPVPADADPAVDKEEEAIHWSTNDERLI